MPATPLEQDRMYNHALNVVRGSQGKGGVQGQDRIDLLNQMYAHRRPGSTATRGDIQAALNRAERSWAAARAMDADPTNRAAPLKRNIPHKPRTDGRHGRYEYQVVVIVDDGTNRAEHKIVVRSNSRLTAAELHAMAGTRWANLPDPYQSLRAGKAQPAPLTSPDYVTVGVTFDDFKRYGG